MEEDFSQPGTLLHDEKVSLMVKLIYRHVSRFKKQR